MASAPDLVIRPAAPADQAAWRGLWRGYLDFYRADISPAQTELTWRRLLDPAEPMFAALAVRGEGGAPVGLVHWLTHRSTWAKGHYAYLEDLFVDPAARAGGVGRALIAHVYQAARAADCDQVYWLTHETNVEARRLYDRIATRTGFLHYAQAKLDAS